MDIRECSGTLCLLPLHWVSVITAQTVTKQPLFDGPRVLVQGQLLSSLSQFRADWNHICSNKSGQMPWVGIATIYSENFLNREGTLEIICSKPLVLQMKKLRVGAAGGGGVLLAQSTQLANGGTKSEPTHPNPSWLDFSHHTLWPLIGPQTFPVHILNHPSIQPFMYSFQSIFCVPSGGLEPGDEPITRFIPSFEGLP